MLSQLALRALAPTSILMRSANWLKMLPRFGRMRPGAGRRLYHDIGKVAAPDHFVENQSGDNPHDRSNQFKARR